MYAIRSYYEQALKYIDALKIDLELYKAESCAFLIDVVDKSVGWKFTFTRKISNAQVRYDGQGFIIEEDAFRITSYNVCYTKLLRTAAPRRARLSCQSSSAPDPPPQNRRRAAHLKRRSA